MQRRLAAILAADVAGYSRLMGEDEARTLAALAELRAELFEPVVLARGGKVIKRMGDGWIVEFPNISDATASAIEIQERLQNHDVIKLRVGVHIGDVTFQDEDIYGDGINIAARLEALAEPGQVLISDTAHQSLDAKASNKFRGGEQHDLKNIARPVAVWSWPPGSEKMAPEQFPLRPLSDKPSIAVLPFVNMSGDPEQDVFADGMTEDIITELSRFPDLLVIARNSAFTYKSRTEKAQKIGLDLGVKYIANGSVRKSDDRVRISVQLIDCETGEQLWAERYDRKLLDVFDLQDELTMAIVGLLPGRVRSAEKAKNKRKPPNDMNALDCLFAGKIHHHRATKEDNAKALRLLNKAIEIDPEFGVAYAWKACTLGQAIEYGFSDDLQQLEGEAINAVQTALSFDENDVECHRLLCEVCMERMSLDEAMFHNERAISLNPNDPRLIAQRGELLTWLGRPDEGVEYIEKALRLDPFDTVSRAHLLGRALYGCHRYDDARAAYRKNPSLRYGHLAELAACYGQLGMPKETMKLKVKILQIYPDFSARKYIKGLPYVSSQSRKHLLQGLIKAGFPDGDL